MKKPDLRHKKNLEALFSSIHSEIRTLPGGNLLISEHGTATIREDQPRARHKAPCTPRSGHRATRLPSDFITIRSQPGHEYHATLRVAEKPWPVVARCSNTSGPLHAAEAVMRKAGHRGVRAELVPLEQWAEASNGYAPTSRARISHLYRIVLA